MPGFWEVAAANRVLVAILHTDLVSIAWAFGLRNLVIPGHVVGLAGMPYDMARNMACMRALEMGVEAVVMLDSDVIAPQDTILRLLAHNLPIVSGLYCRRSPPAAVPVMQKPVGHWVVDFKPGSMVEVDVVGSGCLLIRREVLERLPPQRDGHHWFDWRVDCQHLWDQEKKQGLPPVSEDFAFCLWAKQHGFPVWVDTSVVCRHVGLAQAGYRSFDPCEATSVT